MFVFQEILFQNLEISNLKQKILEIGRVSFQDSVLIQSPMKNKISLLNTSKLPGDCPQGDANFRIYTAKTKFRPLKNIPPDFFRFVPNDETIDHSTHSLSNRRSQFLQSLEANNSNLEKDRRNLQKGKLKPGKDISKHGSTSKLNLEKRNVENQNSKRLKASSEELKINSINKKRDDYNHNYIYPEVFYLTGCSLEEIQLNRGAIGNVLRVFTEATRNFHGHLRELENNRTTEIIRKLDTLYLEGKLDDFVSDRSVFDSRECCEREIGVKCRQLLAFISEVMPFSPVLQAHVFEGKHFPMEFPLAGKRLEKEHINCENLEPFGKNCVGNECNLRNMIFSMVEIIGRIVSMISLFSHSILPISFYLSFSSFD